MRVWVRIAAAATAAAVVPLQAAAAPEHEAPADALEPGPVLLASDLARDATTTVTGVVTRARSRWAGSSIITESTIRTAAGAEVEVVQLGGAVGDVGMWVSHMPPVLAEGYEVHAEIRSARTLDGEARWSLADVAPAADTEGDKLPFVRTITSNRTPVRWASGCVFVTYHEDGTAHLAGDREFHLIDSVFQRWERDAADCSYLRFIIEGRERREVGFDGVNLVMFRHDRWCRPPAGNEPEICYSPSAAGLTTLFFINDPNSPHDGEIIDADIELNGVDFAISSGGESLGQAGCIADLANTLAHEVGHLLGLDHTCWDGSSPRPSDHEGNPAPDCSNRNLSTDILDATMYAFQECGETKKASLTADDVAGKCAIYQQSRNPGRCEPVSVGGCCSLAAAGPHAEAARGGAALALLAALVLLRLRRPRTNRVS
jgi:hypothetical protein